MHGNTYRDRDNLLKELGYGSYEDYLASPKWKELKKKVLGTYQSCRICGKKATVVHHISYGRAVLLGTVKGIKRLVSLCQGCHRTIELKNDGTKRTLLQSQQVYRAMLQRKKDNHPPSRPALCINCGKVPPDKAFLRCKHCQRNIKRSQLQLNLQRLSQQQFADYKALAESLRGKKAWWHGRRNCRRCFVCNHPTKRSWLYCMRCRDILRCIMQKGDDAR